MSEPFIAYLFPAGGQCGTTVQVTAVGRNLDQATGVRITGAGVSATIVRTVNAMIVTFSVTIAGDAPPGERDLRFNTPDGFTNRFRFFVGQIPEILEKEPNDDLAHAQLLQSLPVVINGQILEGDRDFFRFSATRGQTLVFAAQGRALQPLVGDAVPGWNDVCLTLYDSAGRELQTVDDFRFHPDPLLFFRVPADGEYVIEARDTIYRGREDFVYRLSIGELPWVTDLFPLGGQHGTTVHLTLRGVNLPSPHLDLAFSADCPPLQYVGVCRGGLSSNRLPFAIGDLKEIPECEPNDSTSSAQRLDPPIAIDGRIDHPGDMDYFTFNAQAGQKLVLDVQARRLESPLDAILTLYDAAGKQIAQADDTVDPDWPLLTHQADPRLLFTFPTTGSYTLRLRDVQGKGGPEYGYRLVIAPPKPDFAVRVTPDHLKIAAADSTVLTLTALRKDGFRGAIDVSVPDLPPGFSTSPATIPAGQDHALLTLTAPADVTAGMALSPRITAAARIDDGAGRSAMVTHEAFPAETLVQAFAYTQYVPTREFLVSVVPLPTFTLAWDQPPAQVLDVPQDGQVQLKVKVCRDRGTAPVGLKAIGLPGWVVVKYVLVQPNQAEATVTLAVMGRAPVEVRHNVIVTGTLDGQTRTLPAIPIRVIRRAP